MELNFEKELLSFLQFAAWENQNQELTQELRLTDDLPDAGRVLGCWGQSVLRSKEWRSGGMQASGGIMAWVVFAPEDGTQPRCMEAWIPFQAKWNFPAVEREGLMNISCSVCSADARVISARKLMLRFTLGCRGAAVYGAEAEMPKIGEVPPDVQLLEKTYPMTLPVEAGEKGVQMDEELEIAGLQAGSKLMRCLVHPKIQEQRIIGDRLVFRGIARLQLLLWDGNGLRSEIMEQPFSAFSDLDREYEGELTAQIDLALTSLETELTEDGHLRLKAAIAAQYILWNRKMVTVVEDAFSPRREVRLQEQILMLPALLDHRQEKCRLSGVMHQNAGKWVDGVCQSENPVPEYRDGVLHMGIPGHGWILARDADGVLSGTHVSMTGNISMQKDEDGKILLTVLDASPVQLTSSGADTEAVCEMELDVRCLSGQGISMVTGMELGELREEDQNRPTLVLCRCTGQSLWEMAKLSGSTVDTIRIANGLEAEAEKGRMLLIPVQ